MIKYILSNILHLNYILVDSSCFCCDSSCIVFLPSLIHLTSRSSPCTTARTSLQMCFERCLESEWTTALRTFPTMRISMCTGHVTLQIATAAKSTCTQWTRVVVDTLVVALMSHSVLACGKGLSAYSAAFLRD